MVFTGIISGEKMLFPWDLEQGHSIYMGGLYTFWKIAPFIPLNPSGAGMIVQLELLVMSRFLPELLSPKV